MDRGQIFGNLEVDNDSLSGESSGSDSESDVEGQSEPITVRENETSERQLTLFDDDNDNPLLPLPPEYDGEGDGILIEDDEGEAALSDTEKALETGKKKGQTSEDRPETDSEEKPKKKKKKKKKFLSICLSNCKYDSVRRVSRRYGFKECGDDEDWNMFWTDFSVALERVMDMKKYQKINHFPGMSEICRKDLLARNMNRMLKLFPKDFNVFPKSWCLPSDYGDLMAYSRQKKHKTYILKPESGCQGKGIWLTKNVKDIKPHEHMVCQQYLGRPFLIDGFKFDFRIYTVVTSCDPLRIFNFKDGLARFATTKYYEPTNHNTENVYMHLTNYAINKHSQNFVRDDEAGSKRRITTINRWWKENGYNVDKIWADVDDVIIKTLISAHPILKHNYRTCFPNHVRGSACFEILGFDVMFDKKLKPYVVEVNHSPSFHTDAKLDKEIKEALLWDTLNVVNFGAVDKKKCIEEERRKIKDRLFARQNKKETKEDLDKEAAKFMEYQESYEDAHMGNLRRIYPAEGTEKYDKYFQHSGSLFQETAAFKARSEAARLQREEIIKKQEKLECMLKGKKRDGLRPESPGGRRRRSRVPSKPLNQMRRLSGSRAELGQADTLTRLGTLHYAFNPSFQLCQSKDNMSYEEPVDTLKPMEILEEEELERISSLLQRDNLVRGLGIVEHVYRLLHCTPGTMGYLKGPEPPRQYNFSAMSLKSAGSVRRLFMNKAMEELTSRTNHLSVNDHSHMISSTFNIQSAQGRANSQVSQPPVYGAQWQSQRAKGSSIGQYGVGSLQRQQQQLHQRYVANKKPTYPSQRNQGLMPESEYRTINNMMEDEKSRVYAQNNWKTDPMNNGSVTQPGRRTHSASSNTGRREPASKFNPRGLMQPLGIASTPPTTQLSAVPFYQSIYPIQNALKGGIPPPIGSQNLSVVSAPAPVVQRPELSSAGTNSLRGGAQPEVQQPTDQGLRSTKSQRIRGASNNVRLKQIEMRENHAVVLS
ncbi:tubulin polyglutamylase ttll6-like [Lineus longissimus]|uniref:tubulin polyglutamylase ttll6-like n=1 Tax=Lineus longissimus TaxID=88925 RepID=UPI00315CE02F